MERPTPVSVIGILNIVFGVYALFGVCMTLAMQSFMDIEKNPVLKLMHDNPSYSAWVKITIPLGFIAGAILIAAGIGLLRLAEWARRLSIGYAVYAILMATAVSVTNYIFILRPAFADGQNAGAVAAGIGAVFGGVFGLAYPIVLIVFMTRANIVSAFRPPAAPPNLPIRY